MLQKYNIIVVFLIFIASCKPESMQYSDIPALNFNKVDQILFNGKDSIVNIYVNYSDGDGDIGLNTNDTLAPYNFGSKYFHNLFIEMYKIENGVSSKITLPFSSDTINFNDRITNLTPTGKNKSISGEILLPIKSSPYNGFVFDSIYYTIQIVDRKLNLSNKVRTPALKFQF